jgi:hypothetical protein
VPAGQAAIVVPKQEEVVRFQMAVSESVLLPALVMPSAEWSSNSLWVYNRTAFGRGGRSCDAPIRLRSLRLQSRTLLSLSRRRTTTRRGSGLAQPLQIVLGIQLLGWLMLE